jgi:hypothetical protein
MSSREMTIRELDGHDLADSDSCDVYECDGHATYAIGGADVSGWVCERHVEQSALITGCPVCGALITGRCGDEHR